MAETACPCCTEKFSSLTVLEEHLNYCGLEPSSMPSARRTLSSVGSSSALSLSSSASTHSSALSSLSKPNVRKNSRQTHITLRALKKMDESTQVALALSASMQDPLPILPSKRGKRGEGSSLFGKVKFAPPPPILIERDPKDSYKIVADRVAVLVTGPSTAHFSCSRWQLPASKVSSLISPKKFEVDNEVGACGSRERELWSLSERVPLRDVQSFYVPSLLSAITPCKVDVQAPSRTLSQIIQAIYGKSFAMLYSLAFTFLAYVLRQSFAILPPNYESLDAQEKQNILWSQISANPYFLDQLPTAFPQYPWVNLSQLMNVSYVRVMFERYSDEMPIGRVKITAPYGAAARFRWVPFQNTSAGYTGLYKSTALGIVRLSIVNWKQFAPQLGVKFFVDGKHSRTMLGFKGVADRPSRNFFEGPFSDIFTSKSDSGSEPHTPAFIASIAALDGGPNDRPEGPNSLSPYELGEINPDGTSVGDKVVSPFHVEMRVPDELFNKISPDSKNDFRADIIDAAPAGTLLFTVWGQAGPGAASEPIGQIYTISNFVASKYADEVLFFRHPHKRWVPPLHHSRNHGYNFEVNMGFTA